MKECDLNNVYYNKIVDIFNSLGVSKDKCIETITTFNKRHRYPTETLYYKLIDLINYLKSIGIEEEKIGSVIVRFYTIFTYDIDLFKDNYNHLLEIGFTKKEISKMIILAPTILAMHKKIDDTFKYLNSKGLSKEEVISMAKKSPSILNHSKEYIGNRLDYYSNLGMSDSEVLRAIKRAPTLITFSNERLDEKIDDLVNMGFNRIDVLNIIRINPSILAYTKESIMDRLNVLIKLGFTKEEAIRLYSYQKTMFTTSPESIKEKIDSISDCDYTKEDVKKIIGKYPGVTSLDKDSIKDKLTFYNGLGLHNIIIREPKHLMQSLALSKARSSYFNSIASPINESNYRRLFMGEKVFIKQFNKTNKEIIDKYNK